MHCPKNILNLRIKTEPVTVEAHATGPLVYAICLVSGPDICKQKSYMHLHLHLRDWFAFKTKILNIVGIVQASNHTLAFQFFFISTS